MRYKLTIVVFMCLVFAGSPPVHAQSTPVPNEIPLSLTISGYSFGGSDIKLGLKLGASGFPVDPIMGVKPEGCWYLVPIIVTSISGDDYRIVSVFDTFELGGPFLPVAFSRDASETVFYLQYGNMDWTEYIKPSALPMALSVIYDIPCEARAQDLELVLNSRNAPIPLFTK